jgi:hypothetical protein
MVTEEAAIDNIVRDKPPKLNLAFSIGIVFWRKLSRLVPWLVRLVQLELGGQEGSPQT